MSLLFPEWGRLGRVGAAGAHTYIYIYTPSSIACYSYSSIVVAYYYTMLCYTILCCTILYYTILYYTILYYTILYYTILYYTPAKGAALAMVAPSAFVGHQRSHLRPEPGARASSDRHRLNGYFA